MTIGPAPGPERSLQAAWGNKGSLLSLVRKVVPTLLLLLIWIFFNYLNMNGLSSSPPCSLRDVEHTNWVEAHTYDPLMNHRFNTPVARDVAVVTITPGLEPRSITTNTCVARKFLTSLVRELDELQPRVIALDMSYSEGSCLDEGVNTEFRNALESAHASVVVGRPSERTANPNDDGTCLVLSPPFVFATPASVSGGKDNVHAGLLRLNENSLKIPLQWPAFRSEEAASEQHESPMKWDTFSFVAAKQVNPVLDHEPDLKRLLDAEEHPYGSFVRELPTWTAMDFMCFGQDRQARHAGEWGSCTDVGHKPFNLAGKVVVVGERVASEEKPFPGGAQYGSYLHANYIQALLDHRYVHYSSWLDFSLVAIFIVFTALVDMTASREKLRGWWPTIILTLAFVLELGLVYLLTQYGWYPAQFILLSFSMLTLLAARGIWVIVENHAKRIPAATGGLP